MSAMNTTLRETNSRIDRLSASLLSRLRRDRSIGRMVLILLVGLLRGVDGVVDPEMDVESFITGMGVDNLR